MEWEAGGFCGSRPGCESQLCSLLAEEPPGNDSIPLGFTFLSSNVEMAGPTLQIFVRIGDGCGKPLVPSSHSTQELFHYFPNSCTGFILVLTAGSGFTLSLSAFLNPMSSSFLHKAPCLWEGVQRGHLPRACANRGIVAEGTWASSFVKRGSNPPSAISQLWDSSLTHC